MSFISFANPGNKCSTKLEVLDNIMEDKLSISKLPTIEVKCIDGRYVSSDNRRLCILKQYSNCSS
jgi:hypothetical protein